MTSQAPESPEVVGERAAEIVARFNRRRPAVRSVTVVSLVLRQEQTPAMMPPPPQRYAPVSLAVSPAVTWEQAQAAERAAEPWGAVCERILALPVLLRGPEPERKAAPVAHPPVPELVTGADAAARRARMARLAATIGEARALLAGEPAAVVRRAQEALVRAP